MLNIQLFLAEKNIAVLEELPNLLVLCDFFLFSKLKGIVKVTRIEGMDAIKRAETMELTGILEESFQQCIEVLQRRMGKCIILVVGDFEGEIM